MASQAADFAPVRLSTAWLPPRERIAFLREVLGRTYTRFEIEPLDGSALFDATLRALPGLSIVSVASAPVSVARTRALVADGNDDFVLIIPASGSAVVSQSGNEAASTDGGAILVRNAEPGAALIPAAGRFHGLRIPAALLDPLIADRGAAFPRLVPRDAAAMRLLVRYLDLIEQPDAASTPALGRLVAAHIQDLVALALGATREAAAIAQGRGVRAARLGAIKDDIARNFDQRKLSIGAVAARHGITPRYVQRLFEEEGITFSQFVLAERLRRAHRMLTDPGRAHLKISAIAFELGFGDLSHFNRAFRRRFGVTPSDVRGAAFSGSG